MIPVAASSTNLRPRSLPELLDAGVALYRDHFLHFLAVTAVINLPLGLLNAVASSILFSGQAPSFGDFVFTADPFAPEVILAGLAGVVILWLLGALAGTLALAALLCSLQARLGGERPGVLEAYRVGLRRVPSLIGTRLLLCHN